MSTYKNKAIENIPINKVYKKKGHSLIFFAFFDNIIDKIYKGVLIGTFNTTIRYLMHTYNNNYRAMPKKKLNCKSHLRTHMRTYTQTKTPNNKDNNSLRFTIRYV